LIYEEGQGKSLDEIVQTLKSSTSLGQFYFRLDTAKGPQEKPVQGSNSAVDRDVSDRQDERQSSISSRPARPNFLERLKGIVLGE
jgi:hypothetical protein